MTTPIAVAPHDMRRRGHTLFHPSLAVGVERDEHPIPYRQRGAIVRHFLVENWLLTTAGLVLGAVGAYALNFLLVSRVSDVRMDWKLVAAGMVLLWVSGLLSTIPPALRAATVPPSLATRSV